MRKGRNSIFIVLIAFLLIFACDENEKEIELNTTVDGVVREPLANRSGSRPETTTSVPHVQIGVELVPEVHAELIRRIYSIPGIEDQPSVVARWRGIWISEGITILQKQAVIGEREFAHIHDDGSLHIFLEPLMADEVVESGWGVFHPYAVEEREGWDGFVMLYTPQSIMELNVTFRIIVEAFNYITGQRIVHTDYYDE